MKNGYYWAIMDGDHDQQIVEVLDGELYLMGNDRSLPISSFSDFTPINDWHRKAMSRDWYQDIVNFNTTQGHHIEPYPNLPPTEVCEHCCDLIKEEYRELMEALDKNNLVEIADNLIDLIYVVIFTSVAYGIDLRPVWDIVHQANMTKIPPKNEFSKSTKPSYWVSPNYKIETELMAQTFEKKEEKR